MSDEENSLSSSDMNEDEEEDLGDPRNTAYERVWSTFTDLGERENEQEVSFTSFTEQVRNVPYNPVANDRGCSGGSADPIDEIRESEDDINDHDIQTREAPIVHTAANQARQWDTDRVDEPEAVNNVQGLTTFILEEMDIFINKIYWEVRTDKENLLKLWEDLFQATSIITTAACSIFIKQPATAPRAKEIQRKICILLEIFNDNVMLKILLRVVVGFLVTRFLRGSSYTAVSSKGI